MSGSMMDEVRLKQLFKGALVELLAERRDLVADVVEEVIEDVALTKAIREGEHTPVAERADVLRALGEAS